MDRVRRFWSAPNIITGEGMKAVALFEAIERGKIKALWVMGTNPIVSMPRANRIRESLKGLDLYVVSEAVADSDSARAVGKKTVLLPPSPGARRTARSRIPSAAFSRQRSFLTAPGEARADWAIIADVAKRLGHGAAFAYPNAAAIFREHAALSGFENNGSRDFDIGAFSEIPDAAYARRPPCNGPSRSAASPARASSPTGSSSPSTSAPVSWPCSPGAGRGRERRSRLRPQHRPGARPLAHDDAHRQKPAPLRPPGRALRGDPPG